MSPRNNGNNCGQRTHLGQTPAKKVSPPAYFFAAIVLMALLHFLAPVRQLIEFPWRLIGLVPLAVGSWLPVAAERLFRSRQTPVKPFTVSTSLVIDSVFSFTRNPMYLGLVLILAGIALLMGTLSPWVVVPVFGLLMDRLFIRVEEAMLRETFGQEYEAYRNRVRRWI